MGLLVNGLIKWLRNEMEKGSISIGSEFKEYDNLSMDIINYENDDKDYHLMNVYYPKVYEEGKLYPLVIDIHGGAWMYGDKELNKGINTYIAKEGFIVISMSYRLLPEFVLSDIIDDVYSSIRFISKLYTYPIDYNNVFLMGDSAGGHIALLMEAIMYNTILQNDFGKDPIDLKIRGVILNHPAPFVKKPQNKKLRFLSNRIKGNMLSTVLYGKGYKKKASYKYYDIYGMIHFLNNNMPRLVISSVGDTFVGDQVQRLIPLFQKNHVDYEFYMEGSEKCEHVYNVVRPYCDEAYRCNDNIIYFIKKNLTKEKDHQ